MFDDRNNPIKRGNGTIEEGENSRNVLEQMRGGEFTMIKLASVQFSSVAQSCPTLCIPMDRSMPGFPVHHQLLELTQTHVH